LSNIVLISNSVKGKKIGFLWWNRKIALFVYMKLECGLKFVEAGSEAGSGRLDAG